MTIKAAVVVFPGTNREGDMARALKTVTGRDPAMVWHRDTQIPDSDLIVLPGGFSYGDYLRCGAMAAHSPVMREVIARAKKGVRILGVCNGFQMLVETGLVPGALLRNAHLKFLCKRVFLKVESNDNPFLQGYQAGQKIHIPVAHGEGNYFADAETLKRVEGEGLVAFRYLENCNGSQNDIAGVFNKERTILGMMPHPEDAVDPQHGGTDGIGLFKGIAEALA